jgi:hypothetical protein
LIFIAGEKAIKPVISGVGSQSQRASAEPLMMILPFSDSRQIRRESTSGVQWGRRAQTGR